MPEQEKQSEIAEPGRPGSEVGESSAHPSPDHAAATSATAVGETGSPQAEAAAPSSPEAEQAAPPEAEPEEEKVPYDLTETTPRAGSIVDIKFKVAHEQYGKKTEEFYKRLRQTVVIEGFRRGKAPLKLIQNRYHKEVKQDALDELFGNCMEQIITEKKYTVYRQFDRVDPEVVEGQDLVFNTSLEVQPQLDPQGYDQFDMTVDAVLINEAAVDAEMEKLRRRHATFQTAEMFPYTPDCGVTLDIRVSDDKGNEIKEITIEDRFFASPQHSLPPEVEQALRGRRAGELVVANVANTRRSEGGIITSERDSYHVKVREVKRRVLPELNDEFAQDFGGVPSLQGLRDMIRDQLDRREQERVRDKVLEKIYDLLIERNPFDVPATLANEVYERLTSEHAERLRLLGINLEDLDEDPKDYAVRTRRNADRMARIFLLNRAIAEKEKIEPTEEDVEKAIARRAEEEGRRPLAIRAHLEAHKLMDRFRDDLKYDLVNDLLIARARVSKQFVSALPRIETR